MEYLAGQYDVLVIGAGHAGIEAALAAARLGCKTAVFTINMDAVGNCPCNPSIGGTAKGHLVREIDALGGEMGKTADQCLLQMRMLNRGKGPAVHSLRAQIDRRKYSEVMKHKLELQENLDLRQGEITEIRRLGDDRWQAVTRMNAVFEAKAVIVATGTYLGGRIYVGEVSYESGPDGTFPAAFLGKSLKELGLRLRRFKTGTPARVLKSSIDFSGLQEQPGEDPVIPFSYDTAEPLKNKAVCHISWTNEKTKQIILENIHRSPLYGGKIEGVGPRYCPSLEDKIVRFADKERHQLFIEPCGENTEEMYLQGMSSSLPEEVQLQFYHSIKGLEHCLVMRCAYAIEYDCVDPLQMAATLEFMDYPGLYGAGQFNGSSGYEEAAAQGLVAGMNAALKIKGREQVVLDRASSYIGTLIDDLVTKGVEDPYRMMTSRSEYRLYLRADNADLRLTEKGYRAGIVGEERYQKFAARRERIAELQNTAEELTVKSSELDAFGIKNKKDGVRRTAFNLMSYDDVSRETILSIWPRLKEYSPDVYEEVEIEAKYSGYIKRQLADIEVFKKDEKLKIRDDINYAEIGGLSNEMVAKLSRVRPATIGEASRISGVTPAAIMAILGHLKK